MSSTSEKNIVELGFLEVTKKWKLTNRFFPSKVGGKPAWLELYKLPATDDVLCKLCSNPMNFLCQIYAPLDEYKHCFHRTIFLFICSNDLCFNPNDSSNIIALRSCLSRSNKFYSFDPPDYDDSDDDDNDKENETITMSEIPSPITLCNICGCRASDKLVCPKCNKAFYCSNAHQNIDSNHIAICDQKLGHISGKSTFLFDEFEINIETEDLEESTEDTGNDKNQILQHFQSNTTNTAAAIGTLNDVAEEELNSFTSTVVEDKIFDKFQKRIKCGNNQAQVLRYNRDGEPLWISSQNILSDSQIPNCEHCNGKRVFEFQIMPQLLNKIVIACEILHKMDWGIINVYTCEKSCRQDIGYVKEFVYKQDIVY